MRIGGEPMDYEPLAVMAKRTSRAFALSPAFALVPEDLPGGLSDAERLKLLETTGRSAGDAAAATCALLQLACGGLDEAHNRVTPLSWPDGTLFGGPPIYDSEAREDATLIHCLIHVREGKYPGEFGTGVCVCVCVCDMCVCKCMRVRCIYTHIYTHPTPHTHTHACMYLAQGSTMLLSGAARLEMRTQLSSASPRLLWQPRASIHICRRRWRQRWRGAGRPGSL